MTKLWTTEEINEYETLFKTSQAFIGQKIEKISFYLDKDDIDFNEQPNQYGKSLLNAIEIEISRESYCLGNLFFGQNYDGLNVLFGKTTDFENVEGKKLASYPSEIVGKQITKTVIYWTKSNWGKYFVPQEIEFRSENSFFICSAIEVNNGELNCTLTDEMLVVENDLTLQKFQLGQYGIGKNERYVFENLEELIENEKNIN
ncbi:MAG: hypothetical protein CMP76_02420 [Flavobacterium sp.]|uniref:hypothetical protein n=1 Tax=Flavobacterium sp. TaxID=239 RepID=UPI000C37A4CE|nr:hypothetical protein [Flavobacterium sp.]MBF02130.1 hypothetical protein [Flavobacterium sp.]|tara:strand:+ start:818 stop:1423 length:606 start_codon:yes stop_codon:yes gene_type:complete